MKLRSPLTLLTAAIAHAFLDIPAQFRAGSNISFDHEQCITAVTKYIQSNLTTYKPLDLIFTRGPDGTFNSGPENMTLTIPACEQLCGNMPVNWYTDRGPRLMTWIIPILLLLSNIELSPLDKRRFYTLFQALGDPIDVLWSFIHKIHTGTQLYEFSSSSLERRSENGAEVGLTEPIRIRVVATVLLAFHDLLGSDLGDFKQLEQIMDFLDPGIEAIFDLWRETALELSDGRTDERLRSCFSIFLYILQILSAFVFDIGGGSPNPPGGVIAVALTLTFLIPMVLLSATTGAFTSRRSSLRILRRFVKDAQAASVGTRAEGVVLPDEVRSLLGNTPLSSPYQEPTWDEYFNSLHWNGGKDTYRPWKMRHVCCKRGSDEDLPCPPLNLLAWPGTGLYNTALLWYQRRAHRLGQWWKKHRIACYQFLAATCPILAGLGGGLGILFLAGEGGWSCRHVLLLSMLGIWLLSAALSTGLYPIICNSGPGRRRYHWWVCLVKDGLIGGSILVLVSISAAGFFNWCSCWGRRLFRGDSVGVLLNVNPRYMEYNRNKFPGIVSGIVGFQLVFTLMVLVVNRKGIMVLRWSETKRQLLWKGIPQG